MGIHHKLSPHKPSFSPHAAWSSPYSNVAFFAPQNLWSFFHVGASTTLKRKILFFSLALYIKTNWISAGIHAIAELWKSCGRNIFLRRKKCISFRWSRKKSRKSFSFVSNLSSRKSEKDMWNYLMIVNRISLRNEIFPFSTGSSWDFFLPPKIANNKIYHFYVNLFMLSGLPHKLIFFLVYFTIFFFRFSQILLMIFSA